MLLIAGTIAPSVAAEDPRTARALADLASPCLVAQTGNAANPTGPATIVTPSPVPSPAASGSASPFPSLPPLPIVPAGPGVLRPPPLPSTTPQVTPPPIPSPSPSPSFSPGPQYLVPATPTPIATPTPVITAGPIFTPSGIQRGSPAPLASPTASPTPRPGETLSPTDYAILGDILTGNRNPGQPFDLDGHVNVLYADGVLVGDHAHYDGVRYIDITGNTYLRNRIGDSTFVADSIRFDTFTQNATLINGHGTTTQGVEQGKLYFGARELVTERSGVTHGTHASLTTCANPHGGYHIESKTLEITPGQRAILRHVVLFLGPLAILYLPVLIIPLRHEEGVGGRRAAFIPLIGYSAAEGFYIKAKIGFGKSPYYYGYYRVEYYTKIGYGLGYVASFRTKRNTRSTDVDIFRLHNRVDNSDNWNVNLSDQENISPALRSTERFSYQADYGPLITLPANTTVAIGADKDDAQGYRELQFPASVDGGRQRDEQLRR